MIFTALPNKRNAAKEYTIGKKTVWTTLLFFQKGLLFCSATCLVLKNEVVRTF